MGNFDIRIKNYLSDNNPTKVSMQDVENAIHYFQDVDFTDKTNDTVFDTDEIDRNQFIEALAKIKEVDPGDAELRTNANILFDIYNTDKNDTLSADELSPLDDSKNKRGIEITSFSVWNAMPKGEYNLEEKIQKISDEEADAAAAATNSTNSTDTTDATETATTPTIKQEVPDIVNDLKKTPTPADIYQYYVEIKKHPEISPETFINDLLSYGTITQEQADALRLEFTIYSDADEQAIKEGYDYLNIINSNGNISRKDAIEYCKNNNKLSGEEPVATSETYWDIYGPQGSLSDSEIDSEVADLYAAFEGTGTRNNIIKDFFNSDMTAQDKAKILARFDQLHGSFLKAIQDDYTWLTGQNSIEDLYVKTLMDAAKEQIEMAEKRNGQSDTSAVTLLCIEFYQGTIGQTGTADHFIKSIMKKGTDYNKVIAAMDTVFKDVLKANKNIDDVTMQDCISNDFSGGTESNYLNIIKAARKNS